ncbi:amidohydrolase family protein [Achromobacter sp. 413638]|uniref:amidohydrolase family protein n=1 Tax=Achromobacter sp. 413638 TaxID=3342385 RepID=UPI00370BAB36
MNLPARVVDLHTHLFNARYLPLESVIASAMKKDESKLADYVAQLLYALAGSSYADAQDLRADHPLPFTPEDADEHYLEQIWDVVRAGLMERVPADMIAGRSPADLLDQSWDDAPAEPGLSEELVGIIDQLASIDYAAEGWIDPDPLPLHEPVTSFKELGAAPRIVDVLGWARRVIRKALRAATDLMDKFAWGSHVENYLEFFLTMLKSEKAVLKQLLSSYDKLGAGNIQVLHMMMDMQLAYPVPKPPRYPFPEQLRKMEQLKQDNPQSMFGFSAFDPRRDNWRQLADTAIAHGFLGFKFYPALGYLPIGNADPVLESRVAAFFDYCIAGDIPMFVHCTPIGFQTKEKKGLNAHPKHWRALLEHERWRDLRLCLGHAGGGRASNLGVSSAGWMADNDAEWRDADNFARIVADLCATYPNVYCELGYITELLDDPTARELLVANIERARAEAQQNGRPHDFLDKVAYGSDWHMPSMVDNTARYLDVFVDIMNRPAYAAHRDLFFHDTAMAYLKR